LVLDEHDDAQEVLFVEHHRAADLDHGQSKVGAPASGD
jgi:hypothetical protein